MRRAVLAVLVVLAACTQSDLSTTPTGGLALAVAEAEEIIAAFPPLCENLQGQGYETRKALVDDASPGAVDLAAAACPDDLARVEDARTVETTAAAVADDAVTVAFTRCEGTRTGFAATVTLTNTADVPVGVFGAVRSTVEGAPSELGAPVTVWRIAPGETATSAVEAPARGGTECAVSYSVFLADPELTGDASGAVAASAEVASDDPAVWVPALVAAERAWWSAGEDVDAPATTEDLRSSAYADLVEAMRAGEPGEPTTGDVEVCSHRADDDDADLVSVTVRVGDRLVVAAARRGADRGWRWLGTAATLGPAPCPV